MNEQMTSVHKSPVSLDISEVDAICRGLGSLPNKTTDERRLHGRMCALGEYMAQLEPIT